MADLTKEYIEALNEAFEKQRKYASYFDWHNSDLAERGVVESLDEAFEHFSKIRLSNIRSRGVGNDPPDCEADDSTGAHIAIEVTELVDPKMVQKHQHQDTYAFAKWDQTKFYEKVSERLQAKNYEAPFKGGPYDQNWLVIHTDETVLTFKKVAPWLENKVFQRPNPFELVFLLFSYDPSLSICPYLNLNVE